MTPASLAAVALALGLDSLRAGTALGTVVARPRRRLLVAAWFGTADALASGAGHVGGDELVQALGGGGDGVAAALVAAYAVVVLATARRVEVEAPRWAVVGLPAVLSLDNLVAGASLGMLSTPLALTLAALGASSAAMAWVGLQAGGSVRRLAGPAGAHVAGVALLGLACLLVVDGS